MERARSISKSMMSYLKRARQHKDFLLKETQEFERGKRHLANMMGLDSKEMTQADIDEAITYLFPSGLFDKKARPMMKHPDLLFKAQKDAQFDITGRPHHYLFYTTLPNYYECLSTLSGLLRDLNKYEDSQLAEGIVIPPPDAKYTLTGREWLAYDEVKDKLLEPISESDYDYLIRCLDHLCIHPYSARAKKFIEEYSRELPGQSLNIELPELLKDEETGKMYTELTLKHRETRMSIKTVLNGTGQFSIEGDDILYFHDPYVRTGILFPMTLTGMQDKLDVHAKLLFSPKERVQISAAICIREAISLTIAASCDLETRERLRLAGLLTHDFRRRERKKFGQAKARKKYTWKKR